MITHDCRPNAAYFWDEVSFTHYVHAIETIYPGQEITITYIDNQRKRRTRMTHLNAKTGGLFNCTCSAYSAHPSLTRESDARIRLIAELH